MQSFRTFCLCCRPGLKVRLIWFQLFCKHFRPKNHRTQRVFPLCSSWFESQQQMWTLALFPQWQSDPAPFCSTPAHSSSSSSSVGRSQTLELVFIKVQHDSLLPPPPPPRTDDQGGIRKTAERAVSLIGDSQQRLHAPHREPSSNCRRRTAAASLRGSDQTGSLSPVFSKLQNKVITSNDRSTNRKLYFWTRTSDYSLPKIMFF